MDFLDFFSFFMYVIQHCCRPSDSNVSKDAGIEPRTVAILALTVNFSIFVQQKPGLGSGYGLLKRL